MYYAEIPIAGRSRCTRLRHRAFGTVSIVPAAQPNDLIVPERWGYRFDPVARDKRIGDQAGARTGRPANRSVR